MTSLVSASVVTALADDTSAGTPARYAQSTLRAKSPTVPQPTTQHLYLIRTTLLTLDTANRTGNYSVLRDSSSPTFQQKHTAADLAMAFQKIRSTMDLSSAAVQTPILTKPATITASQQLYLAGTVPAQPSAIAFEMLFDQIAGHWRLGALAVSSLQQTPQRQAANSSKP